MSDKKSESVGFGKPPKQHRFGRNQESNRRGRPRGSKNTKTIIHQIAHERHFVKQDGNERIYTTVELLLLTLSRKAMSGDVAASRLFDKYLAIYNPEDEQLPGGLLVVPESLTMEEFNRRAEASSARKEYLGWHLIKDEDQFL